MEIHIKNLPRKIDLEFQIFPPFFYSTHQEDKTIGRNLIVVLKNGEKVSQPFNTADAY